MSLLEAFFSEGLAPAPAVLGMPVVEPISAHTHSGDALPSRRIAFAASSEQISERRASMVASHRKWLADEQRDRLTACFVPSV